MKFFELVTAWDEIEKIDSRNEITEKLSELLKKSSDEEIAMVVNLSLGQMKPAWENIEFALAEKQVIKAIAVTFDKNPDDVLAMYKEQGDVGNVIKAMDEDAKGEGKSVTQIYTDYLMKLSEISGQGSVDKKLELLGQVFGVTGALERKYLIRVILGKLRLGFSDQTVIDALSYTMVGGKGKSKEIEKVYQAAPDIGLVALNLRLKGEKYLDKAEVVVGVPVVPMLCQRLKSPREMIEKMGKVAVEAKFDGTRVQIHFDNGTFRTFTRNLEETSHMFPELMKMPSWVRAKKIVLDAEAVGIDIKTGKILPFQVTITRKRKHGIEEMSSQIPLRFYVFDVLAVDDRTVMGQTYEERRKLLKEIIIPNDTLLADDYRETENPEDIERWHREYLDDGLEGVIVKKIDSPYVPGRTGWHWVKMKEVENSHAKLADTIDGVVMGFYSGRGKRSGFGIGALLIGIRDGDKIKTLAKIGTGLSDELFKELYTRLSRLSVATLPAEYVIDKNMMPDIMVEPSLVVEVAADEITKSPIHTAGVALRFPRLIKVRDDKGVKNATSLQELNGIKQG
jgi:DNA ligase 1